ncbi:Cysteine metabolism repressor [Limihaloglobus sulfuriphilus]|uniref:Cysteine metabolism repressor n=1 Tax=Limihaloglobus sulfuriphilus TaxID=1851148 RepID=A0A1Q2MI59_9BACT|nr:Rrf2 family transcriptional regulator [Limihaloglobus sulfuriphilus]AQQ72344.1 Cysteine metabolism repressor [Limihaloglobus sulfuriphilus]
MKLSTRSRYGIRGMLELAISYGKGPVQIKSIADVEGISVKYLEQLISQLKAAGLVRSVRGPKGGYILAEEPAKITLFKVFQVLEGPVIPLECLDESGGGSCDRVAECILRPVWKDLRDAVKGVLTKVTFQDLVDKVNSGEQLDFQI